MTCPNCQHEILEGASVCVNCGTRLPVEKRPAEDYVAVEVINVRDSAMARADSIVKAGLFSVAGYAILALCAWGVWSIFGINLPPWFEGASVISGLVVLAFFIITVLLSLAITLGAMVRIYREKNRADIRLAWLIIILAIVVLLYVGITIIVGLGVENARNARRRLQTGGSTINIHHNCDVSLAPRAEPFAGIEIPAAGRCHSTCS